MENSPFSYKKPVIGYGLLNEQTTEMKHLVVITKYKKLHKKIAMGLLSFMPSERELKTLQQTMQTYEDHPDWQLYLGKEGAFFVGLIGIEVSEVYFVIHHVSVSPSHRGEGVGHALIDKSRQLMQPREMRATKETEAFLAKYVKTKGENSL